MDPVAGVYMPLTPAQVYDSSQPGGGWILAAQSSRDVQLTGVGGVPATDVAGVVVDLTVVQNTFDVWGLLWAAGTPRPDPASSINYRRAVSLVGQCMRWRELGASLGRTQHPLDVLGVGAFGRGIGCAGARKRSPSRGSAERWPVRCSQRVKPRSVDSMRATVASDHRRSPPPWLRAAPNPRHPRTFVG